MPKVSNNEKQRKLPYSKDSLLLAVEEVRNGKSIAGTSKKYNIPETTIRAKRDNKYADKNPGPSTVLTSNEEAEIVNWIFFCCKTGFPITKNQLLESVLVICQNIKRNNPFKDGKPGRTWYEAFLRRHPEISERISENVCVNRAKVSEESLRKWFDEIAKHLSSNDLLSIEPNRIFNCDETGNNK